jgi:hypothetical protein
MKAKPLILLATSSVLIVFNEGIGPKCSMLPLRREKDYPHRAADSYREINDEARRLMSLLELPHNGP